MSGPGRTAKTIVYIITETPKCLPKTIMECDKKFGTEYIKCTYTEYTECINKPKPKAT
jgi:hypothetical protein